MKNSCPPPNRSGREFFHELCQTVPSSQGGSNENLPSKRLRGAAHPSPCIHYCYHSLGKIKKRSSSNHYRLRKSRMLLPRPQLRKRIINEIEVVLFRSHEAPKCMSEELKVQLLSVYTYVCTLYIIIEIYMIIHYHPSVCKYMVTGFH